MFAFQFASIIYYKYRPTSKFESIVLFEIFQNSPLWIFSYNIRKNKYDYYSVSLFHIDINVYINHYLIKEYINISTGLGIYLLIKYDDDVFNFDSISNNISYIPDTKISEPPNNFKIKLNDYQKKSLNKISLPDDFISQLQENGFELLDINYKHIAKLDELPLIHRDPFDRMLVAQTIHENLSLVTNDLEIMKYNIKIITN